MQFACSCRDAGRDGDMRTTFLAGDHLTPILPEQRWEMRGPLSLAAQASKAAAFSDQTRAAGILTSWMASKIAKVQRW